MGFEREAVETVLVLTGADEGQAVLLLTEGAEE
jgi:hypothetical protein